MTLLSETLGLALALTATAVLCLLAHIIAQGAHP